MVVIRLFCLFDGKRKEENRLIKVDDAEEAREEGGRVEELDDDLVTSFESGDELVGVGVL